MLNLMNPHAYEQRMRSLEYFHTLKILPDTWVIIRVDGRKFSRVTAEHFEKPYDPVMHRAMVEAAEVLLRQMQGVYCYTESDEISVAFAPAWTMFDREVEKIVSLTASMASTTFSLATGIAAHFDSRIWVSALREDVVKYFHWRQADAARCALYNWCHWTLLGEGNSAQQATAILHQTDVAFKNELLFTRGINYNEVPAWQRRGTALYWESFEKEGFNPVAKTVQTTQRRRLVHNEELPRKEAYTTLLTSILSTNQAR